MEIKFSAEDEAFRKEVRAFIDAKLPDEIAERVRRSHRIKREDTAFWHARLHERGWSVPRWPEEHGGTDWSAIRHFIFEEEMTRAAAPMPSGFGVNMVGPVIIAFGNEEQKERFLPGIREGTTFWCQGYSEPGAGSDLASLQTRAFDDGDDYVVNGQKIWTSSAHYADWMFCLVRTDANVKPQAGITFLLIDMKTPGLEVQPIISIDGGHSLNTVFFSDVRVPKSQRIGEENKGWTYAKFLLGNERTGIAGVAASKTAVARIRRMAAETSGGVDRSLAHDTGFMNRLRDVETRLLGLEMTNLRVLARLAAGTSPGPEASTLKIVGTEIQQALNDLATEVLGYYAAPYEAMMEEEIGNRGPVGPDHGVGVVSEMLIQRAASIYGGTNEIQRNIIAKGVLEL